MSESPLLKKRKLEEEEEKKMLIDTVAEEKEYDYDLIVVGGGSGGMALSKEAAELGAKVCALDFVDPTPQGTTWGLGGTCVNVGCIPKKLFHIAAIHGDNISDAKTYGWELPDKPKINWENLVQAIQDHVRGLNFGNRVDLRTRKVTYKNAKGRFIDQHTVAATNKKGVTEEIT